MQTLYSGTNEFSIGKSATITYHWKFEEATDHEHPFILTVTVADHTHSEGCPRDLGEREAFAKAEELARELYASTPGAHPKS